VYEFSVGCRMAKRIKSVPKLINAQLIELAS
jgi:hypothetical protein